MAEIVLGQPIEIGQTYPPTPRDEAIRLFKLHDSGSRAVIPGAFKRDGLNRDAHHLLLFNDTTQVAPEHVGLIPLMGEGTVIGAELGTPAEWERGFWMGYSGTDSDPWLKPKPVLHVEEFWDMRRILAEHALRFRTEHDPNRLIYESNLHRIETVIHELSDVDRIKAGNVSLKIRTDIGYFWRKIHELAKLPVTTQAERDAAFAKAAELRTEMDVFCASCAGSGLSHRIMHKHPHEDWKFYLDSGVRFAFDRNFTTTPIAGETMLTEEAINADIGNYVHALNFFSDGDFYNDYGGSGAPGLVSLVTPIPAGQPSLPTITGPYASWRQALMGYWRIQNDAIQAKPLNNTNNFMKRLFSWWAASNVIALFRDANVDTPAKRSLFEDNYNGSWSKPDQNSTQSYRNSLWPYYVDTDATLANPTDDLPTRATRYFYDKMMVQSRFGALEVDSTFMPLIPATERDMDGNWKPADRAAMATKVNAVFGYEVLATTGTPHYSGSGWIVPSDTPGNGS